MSRFVLATVLLSGLCACGEHGRAVPEGRTSSTPGRGGERGRAAFFPIGIFGVNDPAALAGLRREGFNAVQTYEQAPASLNALAKAAKKAGMKLLAYPQGLMASSVPVRGFPLAAWYLVDEPDVQKMPPEDLCRLEKRVGAWDPGSPRAFVVGDGNKAAAYRDCGDVLMVDWYPVPHLPLESAGDNVRTTVEAAANKPAWAVLQAFNWKDYPQRDPQKPRIGRFPELREIRFMTYHAVLAGAGGIWYYSYRKPEHKTLPDVPEEWFTVTSVARELAAMRSIFEKGEPSRLPFPPEPWGVQAKAWRYHGRDYVIILNPFGDEELLVPGELLAADWRPLFEPRRYTRELLDHAGNGYYLPPYRVMVFESRFRPFRKGAAL